MRNRSGKIEYTTAPCSHSGVVKDDAYAVIVNGIPSWDVVMPVPPRRTSASPLSPYQSVRLPARTRKSYVRIPGVDGVAAVALQIAPRRCIATYRFPKWSVALEGFVPVTRSRSVTFEPARTAPNGLR